jgi:hypothetical protein
VETNSTLSKTISQLASQRDVITNQGIAPYTLLRGIYSAQDDADKLVGSASGQKSRVCACRQSAHSTQSFPISFIHFTRTFRRHHFTWCPLYEVTGNSLEWLIAFVPPSWLLAHSLNLSFKLKGWRSRKGIELSPVVLGTSRLVDASNSLSFQALANTKAKLFATNFKESATCIVTLKSILENIFQSGKASALDEDRDGNTILSVSI